MDPGGSPAVGGSPANHLHVGSRVRGRFRGHVVGGRPSVQRVRGGSSRHVVGGRPSFHFDSGQPRVAILRELTLDTAVSSPHRVVHNGPVTIRPTVQITEDGLQHAGTSRILADCKGGGWPREGRPVIMDQHLKANSKK